MITRLGIEGFKSFAKADLYLGPLTTLVGANATGKSNIRDAFRFLHGIARGYSLAEIMGEKWGEGGVLQWRGIRGGPREALFPGRSTFALEVDIDVEDTPSVQYRIEVDPGSNGQPPAVVAEYVAGAELRSLVYGRRSNKAESLGQRPLIYRLPTNDFEGIGGYELTLGQMVCPALSSIRFFELNPNKMRAPSLPGATVLGDEGENLSSVLQDICNDPARRRALSSWIRELTPMDVEGFTFPADQTGRILVSLIEEGGRQTSAYSASDGTLRFLAMIAALLGPEPSRLYFLEELDNGIHPTRLHLLLQLIEQKVSEGEIQMVTTTHSPQLLGLLSPDALEVASLTYRLEGCQETRITRALDLPNAREIVEKQDLAHLHASGWLEDAAFFSQQDESPEEGRER